MSFAKAIKYDSKGLQGHTYIYALCDPDTNEVRYVGKADNPTERYKAHLLTVGRPNTHRKAWVQSLIRQGKKPLLKLLEEVTGDNWRERERWWIAEMRHRGARLTNLTDGGDGVDGYHHTEETRRKLAEISRQRVMSAETRAKLSATSKLFANSKEWQERVRQIHTGKITPAETRAKQSAARIGMKFSAAHITNMSRVRKGKTAHNKGRTISYEQKIAVSAAQQKLTPSQVTEIRKLLSERSMTQAAIARQYNICQATVTKIKQGHIYLTERGV